MFNVKTAEELPIGVIGIVGPPRSGKSFLMNMIAVHLQHLESLGRTYRADERFHTSKQYRDNRRHDWLKANGEFVLGYINTPSEMDGFRVAPAIHPVTKGTSVYGKVFIIDNERVDGGKMGVILVDNQGMWDIKNDENIDYATFGITCLISSYFIFNVMSALDTMIVNRISALCSHFKQMCQNDREKPFDHLDIMIRNSHNIDTDTSTLQDCHACSEDIETSLRKHSSASVSMDSLEKCFEKIDVVTFPDPGELHTPRFDGRFDSIKPLFISAVCEYVERVVANLNPCCPFGDHLLGKDFVR